MDMIFYNINIVLFMTLFVNPIVLFITSLSNPNVLLMSPVSAGVVIFYIFCSVCNATLWNAFITFFMLFNCVLYICCRRELEYLIRKSESLLNKYYESIGHQKREKTHMSGWVCHGCMLVSR